MLLVLQLAVSVWAMGNGVPPPKTEGERRSPAFPTIWPLTAVICSSVFTDRYVIWQLAVLDQFDHKNLDKDVEYFRNVVRFEFRCPLPFFSQDQSIKTHLYCAICRKRIRGACWAGLGRVFTFAVRQCQTVQFSEHAGNYWKTQLYVIQLCIGVVAEIV